MRKKVKKEEDKEEEEEESKEEEGKEEKKQEKAKQKIINGVLLPGKSFRVAVKRIYVFRAAILGFYIGLLFGFILALISFGLMQSLFYIIGNNSVILSDLGLSINIPNSDNIFNLSLLIWIVCIILSILLAISISLLYNLFSALGAAQHFKLVEYEFKS